MSVASFTHAQLQLLQTIADALHAGVSCSLISRVYRADRGGNYGYRGDRGGNYGEGRWGQSPEDEKPATTVSPTQEAIKERHIRIQVQCAVQAATGPFR